MSKQRLAPPKKKIVLIIITIVLCVIGIAEAWYIIQQQKQTQQQGQEETQKTTVDDTQSILDKANTLEQSGDTAAAQKVYDDAIANSGNAAQKSYFTLSKATPLMNEGKFDEAIAIGKEAEKIDANVSVMRFLANVYDAAGDKQNAIIYYQKAIDMTDDSDPMGESNKQHYQQAIERLNQ